MRTSGSDKELWMTTVPLGFLVLFLVFTAGGPKPFLKLVEATLHTPLEWLIDLFR